MYGSSGLFCHSALSREIVTLVVTEACTGGGAGGGGGAAALQLGHGGQLGAGARPPSSGVSRLPAVPRLGTVTGNQLAVEGVEMPMGLVKDYCWIYLNQINTKQAVFK